MIATDLSVDQIIAKFERLTFGKTRLSQAKNSLEFTQDEVTLKVSLSECAETGLKIGAIQRVSGSYLDFMRLYIDISKHFAA